MQLIRHRNGIIIIIKIIPHVEMWIIRIHTNWWKLFQWSCWRLWIGVCTKIAIYSSWISRGMTGNTRKSISYQITAAIHFRPFPAIVYRTTSTTVAQNTRKIHFLPNNRGSPFSTIFDHFLPFPAISCHFLPGYRIIHNKKRAETHDCQFRQISAMLTLTSIVGHGMHGCLVV